MAAGNNELKDGIHHEIEIIQGVINKRVMHYLKVSFQKCIAGEDKYWDDIFLKNYDSNKKIK